MIDLDILKEKLRRIIRDKRYLEIMFQVLDASSPGLPKGFYTSPCLSNFYMMAFDNFVTQELKPEHYLRYMDNMFLYHKNKRELHAMVARIEEYLFNELHLRLNRSKQIFRMEYVDRKTGKVKGRAVNALGFVIHRDRVTMRKSILKRARAKANRMHRNHRCRRIDAATMISYSGWFKHTDTYDYFQKWIAPKVSMRYCRKRISTLAKREMMKQDEGLAHCT